MAPAAAALRAWEAAIKHLQDLSNVPPSLFDLTPGVVMSRRAAALVEDAFQDVLALPQGNKKSFSKLLANKVCC